mgnify:FL=1
MRQEVRDYFAHARKQPVTIPAYPSGIVVGGSIYSRCPACGAVVKINKWLIGSLHICREMP